MTLMEWLDKRGMNPKDFGDQIGLQQPNSVFRWLRGARVPTPEWMLRIYEFTNGMVTPNDWVLVGGGNENSGGKRRRWKKPEPESE